MGRCIMIIEEIVLWKIVLTVNNREDVDITSGTITPLIIYCLVILITWLV